jgi:hypothetical protein
MTDEKVRQIIRQARKEAAVRLDLSSSGLTQLPPEIAQLTHLTYLDLSHNQLIRRTTTPTTL